MSEPMTQTIKPPMVTILGCSKIANSKSYYVNLKCGHNAFSEGFTRVGRPFPCARCHQNALARAAEESEDEPTESTEASEADALNDFADASALEATADMFSRGIR